MNPNGNPPSLEPLRVGNTFAVKSGIYSRTGRILAERAQEIAERLLELPHVGGLDAVAAEEIGTVVAKLEAIDLDLERRGVSARGARTLLEHKARLTRELVRRHRQSSLVPVRASEQPDGGARSHAREGARRGGEGPDLASYPGRRRQTPTCPGSPGTG